MFESRVADAETFRDCLDVFGSCVADADTFRDCLDVTVWMCLNHVLLMLTHLGTWSGCV